MGRRRRGSTRGWWAAAAAALLACGGAGEVSVGVVPREAQGQREPTAEAVRVAVFNASLVRASEGRLHRDLAGGADPQARKVAAILQRVRPDAPFSCRAGVCSTCQAVCASGEVEMAVNYGLSDDEVARGYVLTCQSRPTTPELTVDFDA